MVDDVLIYDMTSNLQEPPAPARLASLRVAVLATYASYALAGRAVSGLAPMLPRRDPHEDLLKKNYDLLTRSTLGGTRRTLLGAQHCFLCDTVRATQLDHHLPKDVFPEFAVLSLNLVPVCGPCNQKGVRYRDPQGHAMFLHPYYDSLPEDDDYLIMRTRVTPEGTLILAFEVVQTATMSKSVFEVLASHFKRMDLSEKYMQVAVDEVADQLGILNSEYERDGEQGVRRELLRQAASVERNRRRNHWRVRTLRTLAADQDFCDGGFRALAPSGESG